MLFARGASLAARARRADASAWRSTAASRSPAPAPWSPARCSPAAVAVGDRVVVSPARAGGASTLDPCPEPAGRSGRGRRALRAQPRRRRDRQGRRSGAATSCSIPVLHAPTDRIDAELRLLGERAEAGRANGCRCGCTTRPPRSARAIVLLSRRADPARRASTVVQLVLEKPIAAAVGDRFVVRDTTAQRTIGGGRFLDLRAPARKRRTAERLAQLDALAISRSPNTRSPRCSISRPVMSISPPSRATGRSPQLELEAMAERLGIVRIAAPTSAELALSPAAWLRFQAQPARDARSLPRRQSRICRGIGRERLRLQLEPRLPAPAFLVGAAGIWRVAARSRSTAPGCGCRAMRSG